MMGDRITGALGISSPVTAAMLDAMTSGGKATGPAQPSSAWDADGFRAGMEDILSVERSPTAIRAFLESDKLRILPEEIPLLYLEIRGKESSRFPTSPSEVRSIRRTAVESAAVSRNDSLHRPPQCEPRIAHLGRPRHRDPGKSETCPQNPQYTSICLTHYTSNFAAFGFLWMRYSFL
jgi:hypothetical protein